MIPSRQQALHERVPINERPAQPSATGVAHLSDYRGLPAAGITIEDLPEIQLVNPKRVGPLPPDPIQKGQQMTPEQAEAFMANCPVRIVFNKPTEAQASDGRKQEDETGNR